MSRKGVGIGAFDRSRVTSAHFASHGSTLRASNAQALQAQLSVFRTLLQQFATTHARDIRSDPSFRAQFARMCAAIGVDPLASSSRTATAGGWGTSSVWAQLLGKTVNDFYFGLAVKVVQVCNLTRGENGGLIGLREMHERLAQQSRRASVDGTTDEYTISPDDVRRAVETLKPLGGSYGMVRIGPKDYIRSVPRELNGDQAAVVEALEALGHVSVSLLRDNLGWLAARCRTAIDDLVACGMLWVDAQEATEYLYWSPSFMVDTDATTDTMAVAGPVRLG
ncbi:hypothetical protein CDD81_5082 [Ophiocordyceps australis]|uniref:Vacuolar-sorting protein SNF8 n=1 Tax=Ophiocordyceps australis TaxID=1399860 RepID=A0A2C5XUI5_9HYPO|nr:hypothetical protein CDD81_5082 [Ophiocordyceps australis]